MYCYIGTVNHDLCPHDIVGIHMIAHISKYKKRVLNDIESYALNAGIRFEMHPEKYSMLQNKIHISLEGHKAKVEDVLLYIRYHPENLNQFKS